MRLRPSVRSVFVACIGVFVVAALAFSLSVGPVGAAPAWQVRLNAIRSMSLLRPVTQNSSWTTGCWSHSRYMSRNGYLTHSESPGNPWYSAAGAYHAARSNLSMASPSGGLGTGGVRAIDMWAAGPFHALGMLNPKLRTVGWGLFRMAGKPDAATMNVRNGISSSLAATYPVKWPGPGSTTPFLRYSGGESPDPLAGTGYAKPTGAPIIVRFASAPRVTGVAFRGNGVNLPHKVVTPTTYLNPNAAQQTIGRQILANNNAVYIVPRYPLVSGRTYSVSITNAGRRYSWWFRAGTAPRAATAR